jgi:serine/threonine-protein kinase HipA
MAILQDTRREWRVTPAYDLPSSAVYGDRTMALPIGGKIRQQLSWKILRNLAEAISIPERLAAEAVREQIAAALIWSDELAELPFDANTIRNLGRLVKARIRHIGPNSN